MRVVILGNSAAAAGCVEGLRQRDAASKITLVAREPHHIYSRPLISYLLCGRTDERRMKYRPDDWYARQGVTALLGQSAEHVDAAARTVTLGDGQTLPYDKLLIATGARPFVPPVPGLQEVRSRFAFMTLADARALAQAVTPQSRVFIMGAGLIGLKCAEGLLGRAGSITVADLAGHVLPSILDEAGAQVVQNHLLAQGLSLILGDSVTAFEGNTAVLASGRRAPFDVLVVAVGVRPNTELAREAGARVERGVITDGFGRTSLPGVYAAGDCTEAVDAATGARKIMALLPNAYMQGEAAGLHMAGAEAPFDRAIPMNAMGLFGLHMVTAGDYVGESETLDAGPGGYKRLFWQDGALKGYIIVGDVRRAGIYTALIREQTPLNEIDFDLVKQRPQLMAFSRADRAKKLGGVV